MLLASQESKQAQSKLSTQHTTQKPIVENHENNYFVGFFRNHSEQQKKG
jgi:hypothetical protein